MKSEGKSGLRTCSLCRRKGVAEHSIRVGFYSDHTPENGWPKTLGNNFRDGDEIRAPVCFHCLDEAAHVVGLQKDLLQSLVEGLVEEGSLKEIEEKTKALRAWVEWHKEGDERTLEQAEKILGVPLLTRSFRG